MNYRFAYLCGVCFCLCCFCASMSALADSNDINNPGFEIFDINSPPDFNAPAGWKRTNYTAVMSSFAGRFSNLRPPNWPLDQDIGLLPYEGERFVVLSTGDLLPEPNHAELRQSITIKPGDRLTGAYFFGTNDWTPYDDWGAIQLVQPDTNIIEVNIIRVCVADVESFRSMRGWQRFDYIFDANQAGEYDLRIFISDKQDYIYNSYFAVDGLVICPNSPISGDINADCAVDFFDFAMLANDWLCDCNDLSVFNDPNHNCMYGTDSDNNGIVDFNDLQDIIEYWLSGTMQGIVEP
ncbi:MAG TPA: hypothetical protein DDW84_08870 [Phycisphaerales bacterium]|nr:MAG: hypothetical protein A2Y13_09655 [Planctomycetes bacterium GWC2_45_44]HBG78931.1 hypothetical protein [Phycisphaerales bacterium]